MISFQPASLSAARRLKSAGSNVVGRPESTSLCLVESLGASRGELCRWGFFALLNRGFAGAPDCLRGLGALLDLVSFDFGEAVDNLALELQPEEASLVRATRTALALGSHLELFIRATGCEKTWRK